MEELLNTQVKGSLNMIVSESTATVMITSQKNKRQRWGIPDLMMDGGIAGYPLISTAHNCGK